MHCISYVSALWTSRCSPAWSPITTTTTTTHTHCRHHHHRPCACFPCAPVLTTRASFLPLHPRSSCPWLPHDREPSPRPLQVEVEKCGAGGLIADRVSLLKLFCGNSNRRRRMGLETYINNFDFFFADRCQLFSNFLQQYRRYWPHWSCRHGPEPDPQHERPRIHRLRLQPDHLKGQDLKASLTDLDGHTLRPRLFAARYALPIPSASPRPLRNCATTQLRNCATAQLRNCVTAQPRQRSPILTVAPTPTCSRSFFLASPPARTRAG